MRILLIDPDLLDELASVFGQVLLYQLLQDRDMNIQRAFKLWNKPSSITPLISTDRGLPGELEAN